MLQGAAPAAQTPTDTAGPRPFMDAQLELGAASAPVSVVEYLSNTCSHCAAFDHIVYPQILVTYVQTGRLRLIVRELPTAPLIVSAAGFLFARCRGADEYWPAVRRLFDQQVNILAGYDQTDRLKRAADAVGLTAVRAQACLSDEAAVAALNDRRQAALKAGADSTPTFLFNGHVLSIGTILSGERYEGGELSLSQFADAYRRALRGEDLSAASDVSRHEHLKLRRRR